MNYIGAERLCVEINYFETYNRENVELVDISSNPIKAIYAKGIALQDGDYEVDDLVMLPALTQLPVPCLILT